MGKKPKQQATPNVTVIAEGRDEWGRRYFRLGRDGEPIPKLPPFPVRQFVETPTEVLAALANANCGLFTRSARTQFFVSIQDWGAKKQSFKAATRVGWNDGTYVLPDRAYSW